MMNAALIEAHYLPSIAYFSLLSASDKIVIERHEHFIKQTFRNRCAINSSQGRHHLTVPLTSKHGKVIITDVRIDYSQPWENNHWRTIQSAYASAPFYEYYIDDLEKIIFGKHTFLFDLNVALLSMCLAWLKWTIPVVESLSYEKSPLQAKDYRSMANPKKNELLRQFFAPIPYTQVFGSTFEENLSLIDLVFCVGPAAARVVTDSHLGNEQMR